ncbi:hypothetical protein DICPUDRAFT_98419 [Dictyostelium purpureum]|uniref:Uncharacterized protein n=1 Tax=Dictyostelium purpureum TaxID=5786 RepID=F0ZQ98_DICPU|nr:uncharacterized protein DICPUDRAFT_98419 [Dictyostelium purpureum]EGC33852.1 hypothetical protein DICPUDRAFT_98419 [Dictyostelium purpureum]|eukprot:XP_003289590.1 hypothetical protein DICPUDRAFT_98419 [Dictyostelium purpureum]
MDIECSYKNKNTVLVEYYKKEIDEIINLIKKNNFCFIFFGKNNYHKYYILEHIAKQLNYQIISKQQQTPTKKENFFNIQFLETCKNYEIIIKKNQSPETFKILKFSNRSFEEIIGTLKKIYTNFESKNFFNEDNMAIFKNFYKSYNTIESFIILFDYIINSEDLSNLEKFINLYF